VLVVRRRDETSANPDVEILRALRPAMLTVPGALPLVISSPYARSGALWNTFVKSHGKDDPHRLVWRAPTVAMNPSVPQAVIDERRADDPIAAAAEYDAEFRADVESLLTQEAVAAVVVPGCLELQPRSGMRYFAFIDPSGGSGTDSITLAIAHREGERVFVDLLRERRPPFSPSQVVEAFAADMARTTSGPSSATALPASGRASNFAIAALPTRWPITRRANCTRHSCPR
jgi:hypothetical protein